MVLSDFRSHTCFCISLPPDFSFTLSLSLLTPSSHLHSASLSPSLSTSYSLLSPSLSPPLSRSLFLTHSLTISLPLSPPLSLPPYLSPSLPLSLSPSLPPSLPLSLPPSLPPSLQLNDYSTLLTIFLSPKLRDIADKSVRRADTLIRFIRSMKYVRTYMYIHKFST